jgi:hypothetical protein
MTSNHPLVVRTNNADRVTIAAAGNVTIAAPSSGTALAVASVGGTGVAITSDGIEVGYRTLPNQDQAGNYTLAATDSGKMVSYSGSGGHTFTGYAAADDTLISVMNVGTGNVTIAPGSGTLQWANGSGTFGTGNRTLAVASVATMKRRGSNWVIWGVGLS